MGGESGAIRWGSDYTGGNWWDQYLDAEGDVPATRTAVTDENDTFLAWQYFWADTLENWFFWPLLPDDEFVDMWIWEGPPTD